MLHLNFDEDGSVFLELPNGDEYMLKIVFDTIRLRGICGEHDVVKVDQPNTQIAIITLERGKP